MVKQSEQTPVLRRHGWFAFETFATRMVIEHFQSIPRIVHEIMQYLYLETREAQFEYNLYYDWTGAKKEIEVVFGVNSAQYVTFHPLNTLISCLASLKLRFPRYHGLTRPSLPFLS